MRYITATPLVLGLTVFGLTVLGLSRAQAAPILQDDESGSGVLRVANQNDQSLTQASIHFGASGRFHLTTQGDSQQDFRGTWHGTAPGVYDLDVTQGFGSWGASGSGRAIFNGGELQQFEIAGSSTGEPFYASFGTGGYSDPSPASDGFALNLSFGGSSGFYYGQPTYSDYGHYSDGRNRGNWNGGQGRAYSDYAGNHGQPGVTVNIGASQNYNRGAFNQGQAGPRVEYNAQPAGQAQQINRTQQTYRGQNNAAASQEQWADQPQQRAGQTDQRSVRPQRNDQPQPRAVQPQRAAPQQRASQPQRQASQPQRPASQPQRQQPRAQAGYGSGGH